LDLKIYLLVNSRKILKTYKTYQLYWDKIDISIKFYINGTLNNLTFFFKKDRFYIIKLFLKKLYFSKYF
jgi:hypothetical protein